MKCQQCGIKEATVHLVERNAGKQRDLWLCSECAEAEQWRRLDAVNREPGSGEDQPDLPGLPEQDELAEVFDSMLGFLGQAAGQPLPAEPVKPCPQCGATWHDFHESGRLGCARCYASFRSRLVPLLTAFHRHATHIGRAPGDRNGGGNRLVELSRLRVAMEKAIAAEEFEEAARLRDQLRILAQRPDREDPRG